MTAKRWPAWIWIPIAVSLVLLLCSGFTGLTDDEAYYWVLAQKPALGYAFHPPMVAWFIDVSQFLFGWIFGKASTWVVRLPSCLSMGIVLALALKWIESSRPSEKGLRRAGLALISYAGLMALGWMMVPDVPLFLGFTLCFTAAWKISQDQKAPSKSVYVILAFGIFIAMLGKISAVMIAFSILLSVCMTPLGRTRAQKTILVLAIGLLLALVPIYIWNSQHAWASVLYQIQGRHQDSELSWKRYLRFWVIELFAAGPVLVIFTLGILLRGLRSTADSFERFVAIWIFPAAGVYCLQPLVSDFKPHWAFIVWWPGALALAWKLAHGRVRFSRFQIIYGITLGSVILFAMNVPVLSLAVAKFKTSGYDSKLDVTNDLYGWSQLSKEVESLPAEDHGLYVVGSRYQTASQAAFNLGSLDRVTMLPRDLKARDEWPTFPIADGTGPDWPKLTQPILFVTDNRYDAGPEFPGAHCEKVRDLVAKRGDYLAKEIWIWKCSP